MGGKLPEDALEDGAGVDNVWEQENPEARKCPKTAIVTVRVRVRKIAKRLLRRFRLLAMTNSSK